MGRGEIDSLGCGAISLELADAGNERCRSAGGVAEASCDFAGGIQDKNGREALDFELPRKRIIRGLLLGRERLAAREIDIEQDEARTVVARRLHFTEPVAP